MPRKFGAIRYFASKFVAKLPAVVTFGIMNNNDKT